MHTADFARLRTFLAVAQRGSFVKAAAQLGVSPSTVSETVRALEDRLGVRLFNRTTRTVALTEAGAQLAGRVAPLLADLDSALDDLNRFRTTPAGRLRLSVSSLALSLVVRPRLMRFLADYPDVTVDIVVDDDGGDLGADADAGVRPLHGAPKDMVATRVTEASRFVTVASPRYLDGAGRPRTPADLAAHSCIQLRFRSGTVVAWLYQVDGRPMAQPVSGPLLTDNVELVRQAAVEGLGVAYGLESHLGQDIAAGRLELLLEPYAVPFDGWFVHHPSRRQPPMALTLFIEALRRPAPGSAP